MNLKQKNGISLIILVITIIVMLVLSGAIVSSLTVSNENANLSTLVNDVTQLQESAKALYIMENELPVTSDAAMSKSEVLNLVYEDNRSAFEEELALNKESENVEFYQIDLAKAGAGEVEKGSGVNGTDDVYVISANTLRVYYLQGVEYDGNMYFSLSSRLANIVTLPDFSLDESSLGIKEVELTTATASTVANNPTMYYGEKVNYTTGNTTIDSQVEWQIFHADASNIYLIATDYVHYDLLPTKNITADNTETVYALNKGTSNYRGYFTDMLPAYNGSEDMTDTRLQALNSSYYEYLTTNNTISENNNMKAVAYMLDTEIWNTFAGENADYAIGGPTVELLMKSYSQKHNVDYRANTISAAGYQISKDGGTNWANYYSEMLDASDTQYVINNTGKANGMWLASPTADGADYMLYAHYSGHVGSHSYTHDSLGFRPIVCLNSNVTLKAVTGGYEIK